MGHTRHPSSRPAVRRHRRDAATTTVGVPPIAPGTGGPPGDGSRDMHLPHEQDQRTGETGSEPREVMRQAQADLEAGQVDTDLRATPGLDAAQRERLLTEEAGDVAGEAGARGAAPRRPGGTA